MARQPREIKKAKKPKRLRDPQPPKISEYRQRLKWLYAGIGKDAVCEDLNVWYAIQPLHGEKEMRDEKIVFAADNQGTKLGNYDVGRNKVDLIHWDDYLKQHWQQFLSPEGTWKDRCAKAGRKAQMDTLKRFYNDPRFRDPFPDGKSGAIGAFVNVMHPARGVGVRRQAEVDGQCYPKSDIPLSAAHIKPDAYKEYDQDAFQVILKFLSGEMTNRNNNGNQQGYDLLQIDRAESAFFEHGFRIDREAAEEAIEDVRDGIVSSVINSPAWGRRAAIRVDKVKGGSVVKLIRRMRRGLGREDREDGEDDDDSEESQDESDGNTDENDSSDSDDNDSNPNPLFVGERRRRSRTAKGKEKDRSKGKQRSTRPMALCLDEELGDDEAEHVRKLLNENNGPQPGFRRSAPALGEAGSSKCNWRSIGSDHNEDDSELDNNNAATRSGNQFKGLMSMHHRNFATMSKQGTTPPTPPKSESSASPPPETTNGNGTLSAPSLLTPTGTGSSYPSPSVTPRDGSPVNTGMNAASKRPSPIEGEHETTKRIKSENNYIIMKTEGGPELIILDDDDDDMDEAGAGTSDDPYTLDDD